MAASNKEIPEENPEIAECRLLKVMAEDNEIVLRLRMYLTISTKHMGEKLMSFVFRYAWERKVINVFRFCEG